MVLSSNFPYSPLVKANQKILEPLSLTLKNKVQSLYFKLQKEFYPFRFMAQVHWP